jgi:ribosomal protein S18 acetylase RimI-like enzyme
MDYTISIAQTLNHLFPGDTARLNVLSKDVSSGPDVTATTLTSFFSSGGILVIARRVDLIIGFATLVPLVKISGTTGRVEHVVVQSEDRGKGISKAITTEIIHSAKASGYRYVDLSTGSDNAPANNLYAGSGFVLRRGKNAYRLKFS